MKPKSARPATARKRGFTQAGALLSTQVRDAGAARGFAETRLLTRWAEVCGPELARIARPVKVSYGRAGGFGATLTIACEGARATEVQMQAETIRARVNACYGYNAISRVRLTQEDAAGFAEAQAAFNAKPDAAPETVNPALRTRASEATETVGDADLRAALTALGTNVLNKTRSSKT